MEPIKPASVVYMATAMPSLIRPIDVLMAALSAASSVSDRRQHDDEADDGAEQAELHQRVGHEGAKAVGTAQPVGQRRAAAASGRCAQRPAPRLGHQAADMIGDQPARQTARIGFECPRAIRRRQHRAATFCDLAFAGDCACPPEAMAAGDQVEDSDQARNIGAVGGDHEMDQPVSPQQEDRKDRQPREDHPEQQNAAFRRDPCPIMRFPHRWHSCCVSSLAGRCAEARPPKGPSPSLDQRPQARSKDICPGMAGKISQSALRHPACNWRTE